MHHSTAKTLSLKPQIGSAMEEPMKEEDVVEMEQVVQPEAAADKVRSRFSTFFLLSRVSDSPSRM